MADNQISFIPEAKQVLGILKRAREKETDNFTCLSVKSLLFNKRQHNMKPATAHYVLVSAGESATREIMAELSGSHYSSIPEMSAAVEALLGDFQENSWHIFPAEYFRELYNLNQVAEAGEHLIAFLSVIAAE